MNTLFRPRIWFLFVALACAGMVGYALYVQHFDFIDPCPLCVLQRLVYLWIGAVSLLAFIHGPGRVGQWVYGLGVILGGLTGLGIAGRHLWLQSQPAGTVPDCGMGLNYMLETMPFKEVFNQVFFGSGECAEVHWTFLGLSMPVWTLVWFLGLGLGTLWFVFRDPRRLGP
ncbi:MAG: disulfide bond formation protein B [Xanthomonadales bacterium]|nr:disulfide bond formation protein B [Xanthomonadales bacterium]